MKSQGQTLYYHYNPHGDVIAMTDANGSVVAKYEYDAWGNVLKSEATGIAVENPFGYAGYMYDKEIGMYYLMARYYHPTHGVFLSVDPDPGDEDDPITQNGYTYADNNPVMHVDPDGHWVWFVVGAGFAAYDAYKAYKSGASWKRVAAAGALGLLGGGRFKIAKKAVSQVKYVGKINKSKRSVTYDDMPTKGGPRNGIMYQIKNKKMYQQRYYDHKGRAFKDIDYTNHGNSKTHPVVPHKHYWFWKKKKPRTKHWYPLRKKW